MKRNIKKEFIKAAKEQYKCNLTAQDIIKQTDFFDKRKEQLEQYKKIQFFKKAFITTCSALTFFVIGFSVLLSWNIRLQDCEPVKIEHIVHVKNDNEVLTDEQRQQMEDICGRAIDTPMYYFLFNNSVAVYIYKISGPTSRDEMTYHYFYAVDGMDDKKTTIYLQIDDKELTITKDHNFGHLTERVGNNRKITLILSQENIQKTYYFDD